MKKAIASIVVFWVGVSCVFATALTFDLLNDPALYGGLSGQSSGSVTKGGVVATLTASEGVLNRTGSGFGVNGPGADDTDALNAGQYIDVIFDQAVVFSNVKVSSWGVDDAGEVQLGSSYVSQGSILGTGNTPYDFEVAAGQSVRILAIADTSPTNGFSIDAFTVTIPEPAVIAFIGITGLGLLVLRRFR